MATLIILLAVGTMFVLAVFLCYVLGWANEAFHVQVDPRVEQTLGILPGANCGGCGFVGCGEYAEAVVAGNAPADRCPVGGSACAEAIAKLLGLDLTGSFPYRPVVHCGAHYDDRLKKHPYYDGEPTCGSANLVSGIQGCTYGCLGMGDCEASCKYDAIRVVNGLATVDYEKCVGCGACERACPRHIISMAPFKAEKMLVVTCSNLDFGKDVKAVCKVGCIGCKACTRFSGLFTVENNLPRIDYEKYDPAHPEQFTQAFEKCPMKRLVYVGKPGDDQLAAVAAENLPPIVEPRPETTVDKTPWQG